MYQQSDLKYVNLFQIDIFTHKIFTQLVKKKYLNILMLSDNFVDKQKIFLYSVSQSSIVGLA